MDIIIWDNDASRISRIDHNLHLAMRQLKIKGLVTSMSEPPLLGRMGLLGKVPVLEIDARSWYLKPGQDISLEQCVALLEFLLKCEAPYQSG